MRTRMFVFMAMMAVMCFIPSAAQATPDNCPSYADSEFGGTDKIDTTGDPLTVEVTAPEGKLIAGYCVKAGSTEGGTGGPATVFVDPPLASITISYPSGKAVSHYSVWYVNVPVEPTCETDPSLCPPPPTCETDPSLCPPPPTCETDQSLCPPPPTCETDTRLCGGPMTEVPPPIDTDALQLVGPTPEATPTPPVTVCLVGTANARIQRNGHLYTLKAGRHVKNVRWFVDGKKKGTGRYFHLARFQGHHIVTAKADVKFCGRVTATITRSKVTPKLPALPVYPQFAG